MRVTLPPLILIVSNDRTGGPDDEEPKTRMGSCVVCSCVAVPDGDLCPECLLDSWEPIEDPYEDDA